MHTTHAEDLQEFASFPPESEVMSRLQDGQQLLRYRPHRIALRMGDLIVKIYKPKNALDALLERLFGDRCARSWAMGHALREANLPSPEPVETLHVGRARVLTTRALPEHTLLTEHLKERFIREGATGTPTEKRELLARVGTLAGRLHAAGFVHGDFTASNILLDGDGELHLIDLDRTKRPSWFRRTQQTIDMRLLFLTSWVEISRTEWLRLLASYFRPQTLSRRHRKWIARRVLGARRGRVRVGAVADVEHGRVPYAGEGKA